MSDIWPVIISGSIGLKLLFKLIGCIFLQLLLASATLYRLVVQIRLSWSFSSVLFVLFPKPYNPFWQPHTEIIQIIFNFNKPCKILLPRRWMKVTRRLHYSNYPSLARFKLKIRSERERAEAEAPLLFSGLVSVWKRAQFAYSRRWLASTVLYSCWPIIHATEGPTGGALSLFIFTHTALLNYLRTTTRQERSRYRLALDDQKKPESEHKVTEDKEVSSKSICGLTNSAILITVNRCIKLYFTCLSTRAH